MESHCLIGLSPAVKNFMAQNKITDIYEAILTGLIVCSPEDPWSFIESCLLFLARTSYTEWTWDMFIPDHLKPQKKVISETMLYLIFNFEGYLEPSIEALIKALTFYNNKVALRHFDRLMQYHLYKIHKRKREVEAERRATEYSQKRVMLVQFRHWHDVTAMHKRRRIVGCSLIRHVQDQITCRSVLQAWNAASADARRTREYFEDVVRRMAATERRFRTERGEQGQDVQVSEAELKDVISTMEKILAAEISDDAEPIDPDNPPESCRLVMEIFKFLNIAEICICSRVCRAWRILTQSRLLWKKLDFTPIADRVNDETLPHLLKRSRPFLSNLNLRRCYRLGEPCFTAISLCKNLQDLNLSECSTLNDSFLYLISRGCPVLLMLNVSYTQISDTSLRHIAKNFQNLQYLSISYCPLLTDLALEYLSQAQAKLNHLNISGCSQFTNKGYIILSSGCSSVQEFILEDLPLLTDTDALCLIRGLKGLRRLSVAGSTGLTDAFFSQLSKFTNIRTLKVRTNPRLTDSGLKFLFQCRDLRHLYLMECHILQEGFARYLSMCSEIVVINLTGCNRLTDSAVKALCDSLCAVKLRELSLANCSRLSDLSIILVQKRCPNLVHFQMSNLYYVSEAGLEVISHMTRIVSLNVTGCNCTDQTMIHYSTLYPTLRELSAAGCRGISDLGVQKFAQESRNLESLDLSLCGDISDNGIKNLAFYCRLLTDLKLVGLVTLTDLSIQYVSGVCRYLKSLDISGCHLVTDKGIRSFVKAECKLRFIGLLWCPRVTKEMVLRLMTIVGIVKHNVEDPPPIFLAMANVGIIQQPPRIYGTAASTSVVPPASSAAQLEVGNVITSSHSVASQQAITAQES